MVKKATSESKKRAHGEGSIYQRKDESWAGVTRYVDPETGEKKKHFVYGKSRKEVLGKKRAFEEELKKGVLPSAGKMTVSQWLDTWSETYARVRVRQNTFEGYQMVIKSHLKPSIGSFILKELQPQQVQNMLNNKLKYGRLRNNKDKAENKLEKGSPLSPRMVEYIYSVLHMALEQAVKNGLVVRNVCDAVDKPKKEKHEFMPWTVEQTNTFLSSVRDTRLFPVYLIAWGAGLRRSEILGLKWEDIDFKKGTLTVKRTLVRVKGGYKFGEPKTKKSRRTIPLPEQVIQALKAHKAGQAKDALAWRGLHKDLESEDIPQFNLNNLVFCTEAGEPMKSDDVTAAFKRDLAKAGLPDIRFHDLRHGHATMLLELGEDIKVISDRLGHSTITLTADTYSHVREKLQREASLKLDKLLDLKTKPIMQK